MTQLDRIERLLKTVSDRQDSIENMIGALCAATDFEVDVMSELAAALKRDHPKPLEGLNANYEISLT